MTQRRARNRWRGGHNHSERWADGSTDDGSPAHRIVGRPDSDTPQPARYIGTYDSTGDVVTGPDQDDFRVKETK